MVDITKIDNFHAMKAEFDVIAANHGYVIPSGGMKINMASGVITVVLKETT